MSSHTDQHVSLRTVEHDGALLLEVTGEVDFETVPALRDALATALSGGHARVVVDLADLQWLDSLGVGVLVAAYKRARAARVELVLWRPSSKARAILRLSGLDQVMTVVTDEAADPFRAA